VQTRHRPVLVASVLRVSSRPAHAEAASREPAAHPIQRRVLVPGDRSSALSCAYAGIGCSGPAGRLVRDRAGPTLANSWFSAAALVHRRHSRRPHAGITRIRVDHRTREFTTDWTAGIRFPADSSAGLDDDTSPLTYITIEGNRPTTWIAAPIAIGTGFPLHVTSTAPWLNGYSSGIHRACGGCWPGWSWSVPSLR